MHVFYQPNITETQITLTEDESKHCVRVLRLKKGDEVYLADGKGTEAKAIIIDDHAKKCVLQITNQILHSQLQSSGRSYYLHIMVAPTKNFDRMEWFIEKATEVGIDEITFIETENSERAKVNLERCEKIAISAMKQSKQWYLPKINTVIKLQDAIKNCEADAKFIAWCPTNYTELFGQQLTTIKAKNIAVLIGPEGDFTTKEIELSQHHNFRPTSLGKTILRTETAALFVCIAAKTISSN